MAGAGAYEVTLANDAEFTNEIKRYKTIFTSHLAAGVLARPAGRPGDLLVRQAVRRLRPVALRPECPDERQRQRLGVPQEFRGHRGPDPDGGPDDRQPDHVHLDRLPDDEPGLNPAVDQEARSYKIEVSTVADFASIFDTATVDQTTYTPFDKTYPEGPLYWRVQAIDGSGNTLTKSPARLVNKASPALSLTFPGNGSTQAGVPYFQWNPQAFAATYLIEVYKNGDMLLLAGQQGPQHDDQVLRMGADDRHLRPATTPGASGVTTPTTGQVRVGRADRRHAACAPRARRAGGRRRRRARCARREGVAPTRR